MELMRFGAPGSEIPAVRKTHDEGTVTVYDARPVTADFDGEFWADGPQRLADALTQGSLPVLNVAGQRISSPVARPQAVICIGTNYAAHAAEADLPTPEYPVVFLKTPNTVTGPNDDVRIPRRSDAFDWEVELAVIVGRPAEYLPDRDAARDCIAGFTIANDLSERTFQIRESGGQWSKGKCFPGALPLGPILVTADTPGFDPTRLRLASSVNGEPRQDSTTADMVFDVYELVYQLSQYMRLEPGDIISTGTPEGVAMSGKFPYLAAGDTIEMSIEHLGRQQQKVTQ